MFSLPNLLSLFRLVVAPFLLLAAWFALPTLFLLLFAAALLSDALDGFLARRFGQTSALGGVLDSWGDFALYCTMPPAVWWLWPAMVRQEFLFVATAIGAFLLPIAIGFIKFRRLTSYHTWGAKAAAGAIGLGFLLLILTGIAWPFQLAVLLLVLSALEELAITLLLTSWQANVPSCLHAWHLRRGDTQ